jgi:hypothetical protein
MAKRNWRASRIVIALLVVVVALVALGSLGASCGASTTPAASSSPAQPSPEPTLDFFRGRSYPTPTPQEPVAPSSG